MIKKITGITFFILIFINIGFFVSSIKLSDEIARFEQNTLVLHQQNIELQKELARYDSFQYAASMAASLDYIKKSTPVYLDNLKYAKGY